jgi:cbb3-type cytochrome oxidase subunit 3
MIGEMPMREFLMQTYTIVLPIFMGYVVWVLQRQTKLRDANSRGTMLLLREKLIEYHDKYMELGYIPAWVYEHFCEMYQAYRDLGGNGMIVKMKEEIDELHFKVKEV